MNTIPEPPPLPRPSPPVLVWVISIFSIFGALGGLAMLAIAYTGFLPFPPAQKQYLDSLTWVDHATTVVVIVVKGVGGVFFIMLRRWAYYLFSAALIMGLISVVYQIVARNWLQAVGVLGLFGAAGGWALSLAIIFYARYLVKTKVLK